MRNRFAAGLAPLLLLGVMSGSGCTPVPPTYPGGLSQQEWDSLPPDKRAALQMQQDSLDEQKRANSIAENNAQANVPPPANNYSNYNSNVVTPDPGNVPPPAVIYNWVSIVHTTLDPNQTHAAFSIGDGAGRYNTLKIDVHGVGIQLSNLVVTMDGNERYMPQRTEVINEVRESAWENLPGINRTIRRIEFDYTPVRQNGKMTTVTISGK